MDIYAAVTDRIIAQLETGIIPWQKPWIASNQTVSHTTGKPYSLLNQMLLGNPGEYLTFSQCQKEGGKIKKGENAQLIVRLIIVSSITVDCRNGDIDPMSQAFIQMSAVFSELELSIIRARVRSGMKNAKEKGIKIGRRPTTKEDIPAVFYKHYPAYAAKKMNVSELARVCKLSRPTVYKYLNSSVDSFGLHI